MRRTTVIAATTICLVAGGCHDKKVPEPAPEKKTEAPPPAKQAAMVETPPPEKQAEPPVVTTEMKSIKRDGMVLEPRLTWTGTHFAIVWPEVPEEIAAASDEYLGLISLEDVETFEILLLLVDGRTAEASEPVALEGAGSGPKALDGPSLSWPAWHEDSLALAWCLWNSGAATGVPVRYVLGRWKSDGTPVAEPLVMAKGHVHQGELGLAHVRLVEAGGALAAFWPVETTPKDAGCTNEHGISDGVAEARVLEDGSVDMSYACADVLAGHDAFRFGDGTCVITHNEHIGYHTWITCGSNDYYESTNPYDHHLAVSGGVAVWYDELDEEFEIKGRCLDIFRPDDKDVICARFKSMRLAWSDEGLAVEILTKDGQTHALPLAPGDHVPKKLLRRALAKKVPFEDAVWSGHSIGLAWGKGRQLRYMVLGPDALEGASTSAGTTLTDR